MNSLYKNFRIVDNRTTNTYDLTETTYSLVQGEVEVTNVKYVTTLGVTLAEVKDNLEALISDIDNWVDEEMQLKLFN